MKLSTIAIMFFATIATASPGAISLERSFKDVEVNGTVVQMACVMCPCHGWVGVCTCVKNGCCC
ncbi:hypothetical protein P153DRAFT_362677 [Dothidotthia symphoricarpi CBS 119687]|uniref:Uncharacterized protein n=1 Tax=Dothidotthia symphoricarpi CBS 119687 TaxID=1392245 RepID=A0A6A6AUU9_9PLEO|nr:uncharacterized protein P153DRAFT_362677 [Dothidotthia symphoricarpi CBS 119687]KAF2134968.1 hypothetical protein P153DRAFT_362677 [Dothidotthia symphoricarpi CBS 119687]